MIKAAAVGVMDHMVHMRRLGERPRNLMSKAAPTDRHSTRTEKMAALLVSVSFVNIARIHPLLAEEPVRRSYLERQVVGRVASPDLGGQVAVLRLHAPSAGHTTRVAYSCVKGVYVRHGTK